MWCSVYDISEILHVVSELICKYSVLTIRRITSKNMPQADGILDYEAILLSKEKKKTFLSAEILKDSTDFSLNKS